MFGRATIRLGIGPHSSFNGFRVLAALLHGTSAVGVRQTVALNRGRHIYSAGRPSLWASAHILVLNTLECSCSKINDKLSCVPCTCDYTLLIISLVCIIIFLSSLCQFVSHSSFT